MIADSKEVLIVSQKPLRITRIVSVILNGVVLNKLATQNSNNVDAMADTLMLTLPDTVHKNIHFHEISHVNQSLRVEIGRRINLPQAV
ncbi:MAG: hypothetical protein IH586_21105 [Anaerolineaceae bacterium]|nr:hypothetical protein [Anaerolineaceae bacterium]